MTVATIVLLAVGASACAFFGGVIGFVICDTKRAKRITYIEAQLTDLSARYKRVLNALDEIKGVAYNAIQDMNEWGSK